MIEVSTSEYEFAHGKRPRSEGTWVFFFDRVTEPFFVNGSYRRTSSSASKLGGQRRKLGAKERRLKTSADRCRIGLRRSDCPWCQPDVSAAEGCDYKPRPSDGSCGSGNRKTADACPN